MDPAEFELSTLSRTLTTERGVGATLARLATSMRAASGAAAVCIETLRDNDPQVLASTGAPAPPIHARPPYPDLLTTVARRVTVDGGSGSLGAVLFIPDGRPMEIETDAMAALFDVVRVALLAATMHGELRERRTANAHSADVRFRLISGITWELRDVLGVAGEYVQLLDTDGELTEKQRTYIDGSRRSIASAVRLISDLLELARVEAGQLVIRREPLRIAALIRDLAADRAEATGRDGAITVDAAANLPEIHTDPDLVGQIVDNLIANALRCTPDTSPIHIQVRSRTGRRANDPDRWICISVTDHGHGYDDERTLFDVADRLGRHGSDLTFRLAIHRSIARFLGGDLNATRNPGGGAVFTLWLPV